ncbi:sugar-transfer associated ATP-grasp domain-containing protein [Phytoactinopolyspora mesophila]|uniref:acylphosphatase n=1 Tax=Phytoactinopolyspora mesophila TaxID=2650750 RepID=A0A7K3MAC0_9ACTN|nr:sugar-transfer associated ATP-grasp domain-containing protein [Phytoactinopolyspora mesophila]NDL60249.1 hypothetical protein [Phytoactinopolyspora mesophila]
MNIANILRAKNLKAKTLRAARRASIGQRPSGTDRPQVQHNAVRVIVHGKVQGVGFREYVAKRATRLGLSGWVRNRSDGTVEVLVSRSGNVDSLVQSCNKGPKRARVDHVDVETCRAKGLGKGFGKRRLYEIIDDPAAITTYQRLGIDQGGEAFGPLHRSGLLKTYSEDSVASARDFWREHWSADIDPALHIAYENLTGKPDPRVVPPKQYRALHRVFNGDRLVKRAFVDKSLYPYLVRTERQPTNYLRRINGRYVDSDNNIIDAADVPQMLAERSRRAIIKPSRTANGAKVNLLEVGNNSELAVKGRVRSLAQIERLYGDAFVVQEVIEQHPIMAKVHPHSVNTLRMLTLRLGREIHHLLTFARFGANGRVNDNAGTGGVCVGVQPDGSFMPQGFNEHAEVLTRHPTTGVSFAELEHIPNYRAFTEFVLGLHHDLQYYDLVSWDIAVGKDGLPFFLEHNFEGAMWIYQLTTRQPVFGDVTEDALAYARHLHRDR